MYLKYFVFIFIFIISSSYIQETKAQCTPNISVQNGTCLKPPENDQLNYFRGGYFYIVDYPVLSSSSGVVSITSRENLVFNKTVGAFQTFESGTFTFDAKCSNGSSGSITLDVKVPNITYQPPKCYASQIEFNIDNLQCAVVNINNNEVPTRGPWTVTSTGINTFQCYTYMDEVCNLNLPILPASNNVPQIEVVDAFCGMYGQITIKSPNTYTTIQLYNDTDFINEVTPAGTGEYIFINAATYYLKLESNDCGVQILPVVVEESIGSIQVVPFEDNTCPTKYRVSVGIMDRNPDDFSWLTNDNVQFDYKNFTMDLTRRTKITALYKGYGKCEMTLFYDAPDTIMPITHTLVHTPCSANVEVVLDYPDYITISRVYDRDSATTVDFNSTTKSFIGNYSHSYMVSDRNCFGDYRYYVIKPLTPIPVLIEDDYEPGKASCLYNTSFTVPNAEMFDQVYLSYNYKGIQSFYMINGRIENVPRTTCKLYFTQKQVNGSSCGIVQSLDQEYYDFAYDEPQISDVKYTLALDPNQRTTCDWSVSYFINYTTPSETYSTTVSLYRATGTLGFTSPRNPACYVQDIPYIRESFTGLGSPPTVNVTQNATCLYMEGFVDFNTNSEYDFYIDDQYVGVLRYGYTSKTLSVGSHKIEFFSINDPQCSQVFNITIYNEMPDFKFEIEVLDNITDCDGDTGSFKILDFGNYSGVGYGQNPVGRDGIVQVVDNSQLSFTYGNCMAIIDWIPQLVRNVTAVIEPIVIQPATCGSMSGQIAYSVAVNGKKYDSKFNSYGNDNPLTVSSYLQRGVQDFVIQAGSCWFRHKEVIKYEDPKISYEVRPTTCQSGISYIQLKSDNPNVQFNSITSNTYNTFTTSDVSRIYFKLDNTALFNYINFKVNWNGNCSKDYQVMVPNENPVSIEYDVIYPDRCDLLNITIQIKNPQLYSKVYFNYIPMDSNGRINSVIPTDGNSFLYYLPMENRCDGYGNDDSSFFRQYNVSLPRGTELTEEICTGSNNACLNYTDSFGVVTRWASQAGESKTPSYKEIFGTNIAPPVTSAVLPQSNSKTSTLSSGIYTLIITDFNNPFCPKRSDFVVGAFEPTLKIDSLAVCSADKTSPLNITFGSSEPFAYTISVDGVIQNPSGINFTGGVNHTVQVNITDSFCPRVFPSITYQVPIGQLVPSTFDNSNCQSISVNIPSAGSYRIDYTNQDTNEKQSLDYNGASNSNTVEISTDSGKYSVTVFNKDSGCSSVTQTVTVNKCTHNKKNLGWIAAVVIGAVIVAALAAFGIYKLRRNKFSKVQDIDTPISMKTVPIFTGGKIGSLDEF